MNVNNEDTYRLRLTGVSCRDGLRSAGLWSQVPTYISTDDPY